MRSNLRPALRLSTLRPHQFEMTPGVPFAVICPDCRVWRRINRSKIQPHFLSDETTYCPASAQRVEQDVTPEQWALAITEGVADTASSRPTTVLKKVKAPAPKAVLHIAQRRSDDPVGSDKRCAKRRIGEWEAARVDVLVTDALRQHPLYGARGPIFSLPLPDGVATEPPRKHRKRKGRLAA
uniref:hypothetical protein n=1 Tax=Kitasatospora indigofera TaxID=67307 RepID=UPI002F906FCC